MPAEARDDVPGVPQSLKALGVTHLSEWDVLTFFYRHAASLCTATQIASLTSYHEAEIGLALNKLEALDLIQRSRISQGIRMYRLLVPEELGRRSSLTELLSIA